MAKPKGYRFSMFFGERSAEIEGDHRRHHAMYVGCLKLERPRKIKI
jgi:hypothetical protein